MNIFAFLIATGLGSGLSPIMPGSAGSMVGLLLCYGLIGSPITIRILFWLIVLALGIWSAKCFDDHYKTRDDRRIVIDEVLGMAIVTSTVSSQWNATSWIAALIIFRFFDIVKPYPIRLVDAWSKKQSSSWVRGFGVIADDLVAAVMSLAIVVSLQVLGFLN